MTDTIVAVATAPGRGGIGVVRISGDGCRATAQILFSTRPDRPIRPNRTLFRPHPRLRFLVSGHGDHDLFREAPFIHRGGCGSSFRSMDLRPSLQSLVRSIVDTGLARCAKPGEFTRRAFENGKIDLFSEAEAIDWMRIRSETESEAKMAASSSNSESFSRPIKDLRHRITALLAKYEAFIEYPEEGETRTLSILPRRILEGIRDALESLVDLRIRRGALLSSGFRVVIAGEPNAGKSFPFAQCDPRFRSGHRGLRIPGTTTDTLEIPIVLEGTKRHSCRHGGIARRWRSHRTRGDGANDAGSRPEPMQRSMSST
ncbi:MAG: hypothetical protein MZV49_13195 [Rhodopseudomonas palustris]|nr:hypothetical protein [Rhodopseudomonas palustris]